MLRFFFNRRKYRMVGGLLLGLCGVLSAQDTTYRLQRTPKVQDTLYNKDTAVKKALHPALPLAPKTDRKKKERLQEPVNFKAQDSSTLWIKEKKIDLFTGATLEYEGSDIAGGHLEMNQKEKKVTLFPRVDSSGVVGFKDKTIFRQSDSKYLSDTVRYHYETRKSLTNNTYTTQGELVIFGEKIKKINEEEVFIKDARFTTCNLDHPHFAFVTSKAKFRQQKYAATGATYLQVEGLRIPVPVPFGLFPLTEGVQNGILPPSFDQNSAWGYGLREGGYYVKIKDYVNLVFRGSIYSYGTFTLNTRSEYKRRYRYGGSFNFDFQRINTKLRGDLTDNNSRTFNFNWAHNVDNKAMPDGSFNVNMNIASTQYNRTQIYDPVANFNNSVNSSVNYSRQFKRLPSSLSISGNHSQNSVSRVYDVQLPSVSYNISSFQPLQGLGKVPRWYEKITFQYTTNYNSRASFFDTAFSFQKIKDTLRWGMQHLPGVSLPLPPLGPLVFTPGISYGETWTDQRFIYNIDENNNISHRIEKGFYRFYNLSFNMGVSTNIFGTLLFKQGFLRGIRHVIRPSMSFSYVPNVGAQDFQALNIKNSDGSIFIDRRSKYANALMGSPSFGQSASLSFSVNSSLEIKVRNNKDTSGKEPTKKVSLIDNLSIGGSYNLIRDSLNPRQLSNINFSMATNIAKKVQFNASASLDPYAYDDQGQVQRKLRWQDNSRSFSLGRWTNFSLTLSSQIEFEPNKNRTKTSDSKSDITSFLSEYESAAARHFRDSLRQVYGDYVLTDTSSEASQRLYRNDFKLSMNLGYNISYNELFVPDMKNYLLNLTNQNITLSGNVQLTRNWFINFSTSLNVAQNFIFLAWNKINVPYLTLGIQRKIHCWLINMSVTPLGLTRSLSVTLQPVSPILQDLKIQRNRSFFNQ